MFVSSLRLARGSALRGALCAAFLVTMASPAAATPPEPLPTPEGTWAGRLALPGGANLTLVFHLQRAEGVTGDGPIPLIGTMDSPDQGARGIPIPTGSWAGDSVRLDIPAIQGGFEGRLIHPDTLSGVWVQGAARFPLDLVRSDPQALAARVRPQDPVGPRPYVERPFRVRNDEAALELAGTLTLPQGAGPHPAVVLISGSGPQNRDSEIMGHRPFLVLADHLTRAGIAVLRLDDRGVGESQGDLSQATSSDLATDVLAAVRTLAQTPGIDAGRIGLVGHSEGGLIAPWVETRAAPGEVAFLVLLAGPGLPGREILQAQGALILRAAGLPEAGVALQQSVQALILDVVEAEADDAVRGMRVTEVLKARLAELSLTEKQEYMGITPENEAAWIEGQVRVLSGPWLRAFLSHDPRPILSQVRVPVLALNGEVDLQVPPRENLGAIAAALREGGNPDFTIRTLPSLNHLFQTAPTGHPSEYAVIDETFAPAALEAISSWILERVRPQP